MLSLWKSSERTTVAGRISLLGGAFLVAVLAAICGVMTTMLAKRAQERTLSWVDAKVETVAQSVDAYDGTAKAMVERFFKVFGDQFGKNFTLDAAGGRLLQLGIALNGYHNHCDKFTEITGGAAAVLMRRGDDFVAVAASLVDERGERTVGLAIEGAHPARALLLAGKPYVGRAVLYGRSYITRVQPVRDLQEQIVGALFVAFDLSDADRALDRLVTGTRFFDSGGTYVIDPHGAAPVVVLPASMRGRPLLDKGAKAPSVLDEAGAASPGAELTGFAPLLRPGAADRFAVARKSASTGYWVVGEASSDEALAVQHRTLLPFLGLFGVAVIGLCAGLYVLIRRWIGRPLHELTSALDAVAAGDLSRPVDSPRRDEIGDMMRGVESMRLRFIEMLGAVRVSADAIATASSQIAGGNQDLSRRTEEAAARLQQTTSAMQQITGAVRESADAARVADNLASSASQAAERGGEAVGQVVRTMGSITAASERIAEISGVIDGIAFQTNILALNAAVEAARAGDSGRGFAVVAAEVRSLAQRVAGAAKEIKALVGSSVDEVRSGAQLADVASARMHEIVDSVRRVNETLVTITAGAAEQSTSLGHVNESVGTLDRMTQQNAALVEESAAAAESLRAQASRLVESVAIFRLETA